MSENILITGAAGYIGSHTAKFFLENSLNVVGLDDLSLGNMGAVVELEKIANENGVKFHFYKEDISNNVCVSEILKKHKIEAVVHFAAYSQVGESVQNPIKYYINNVCKTTQLLNAMLISDVKKIVFSSTAAIYGEPNEIPIKETAEKKPINPYGTSKLTIEKIMHDLDSANNLKSIRLRYFNVAGASADGKLGEVHNPETHLIPKVLEPIALKGNGAAFKLFGNDYPTPDGTAIRDYIHVEDLARAHYLAVLELLKGANSNFYNLGSGQGYSVMEVYKACCKVIKKEIPLEIEERRAGDPPILVASNNKAKKELLFEPKKTLEDMISSAWNWINNPKF